MPKIEPKQQPPAKFAPLDEVTNVREAISKFEVPGGVLDGLPADMQRAHLVQVDAQQGPDAYAIRETVITSAGEGARSYRTEQRMELATRLQLPPDYDPADLVGRTFLVPA